MNGKIPPSFGGIFFTIIAEVLYLCIYGYINGFNLRVKEKHYFYEMTDFRLTLTDKKHHSCYQKKIIITWLISFFVFVGVSLMGTPSIGLFMTIIISLMLSTGITLRWFDNKAFINEPFFMITNDFICYRLGEYKIKKGIKTSEIQNIILNNSRIILSMKDHSKKRIKLDFIPEKYVRDIRKHIILFAWDRHIPLERK